MRVRVRAHLARARRQPGARDDLALRVAAQLGLGLEEAALELGHVDHQLVAPAEQAAQRGERAALAPQGLGRLEQGEGEGEGEGEAEAEGKE